MKDKTPYVVVALQEAARMNTLLTEMRQSMEELLLGLGGSLNMSDKMEKLAVGTPHLICTVPDVSNTTSLCHALHASRFVALNDVHLQVLQPILYQPCGWRKCLPGTKRCFH